jgi:hypothetical protein
LADSPFYPKTLFTMKTTLDLPHDVAHTLRMESARRGGRKAASLSKLVTDAVRQVYGSPAPRPPLSRHHLKPGRVIIAASPDAVPLTAERIRAALSDEG